MTHAWDATYVRPESVKFRNVIRLCIGYFRFFFGYKLDVDIYFIADIYCRLCRYCIAILN